MRFRTRINSNLSASPRRGSGTIPVFLGIALFAGVVGVLYFATPRHNPGPSAIVDQSLVEASSRATQEPGAAEEVATPDVAAKADSFVETAASSANDVPQESQTESPAVDPSVERLNRLKAQLAAGEFGPALERAQSAQDVGERTMLLKMLADAQMKFGEFEAAHAAIRRMPLPDERIEAQGQRASKRSLAGGQADFGPLIDLIQNETTGPWMEIDGEGGTITEFESGVRVDPNGLLMKLTRQEQDNRLKSLGVKARVADLNEDMARQSPLRLVSLTRLEAEISKRVADGLPVVETMKNLAGLSKIEYVFVYPEEGELVIAGPAEGWRYNENGIPVGADNGRPTLQLDDLVTVLRTFSPDGNGFFSCLIVPRQEGLKKVQQYVARSNNAGPLRPGSLRSFAAQLQRLLGLQDIEIYGVPADSRVARVIAEADYRMKLIGIGKLDGGSDIPSFFELLPVTRETASQDVNALRWWLTMKYDAVLHSPDHNVFALQGSSVLCQSEDERITAEGERIHTGKAGVTNRLFAEKFTHHYEQLASRDLVFADLQNIFDLSLVAALINHERLDERIGWNHGSFSTDGMYQTAEYEPPQTVMSVVNHRVYNGKDVVVQVAGGVRGDLLSVVRDSKVVQEAARLANFAEQRPVPSLPEGRWWWDAAE